MRINLFRVVGLVIFLGALLLGSAGCASSKPKGLAADSRAAVVVKDATTLQIARAVSETFTQAGFNPVPVTEKRGEVLMLFERQGSTADTVVYGDWSGGKIGYRLRIQIQLTGPDSHLVTCDAYRVYNRGDKLLEEEKRLSSMKHGKYQELLEKARDRVIRNE